MATIKDIAARCGVSIATVSKHINGIPVKEENRIRIDAAIAELGYRVNDAARTLKTRRSMTVGILLDSLSNLFYTSVISEAEDLLQQKDYTSILFETKGSLSRALRGIDLFASKSADGILYLSSQCSPEVIEYCRLRNIPLTVVDSLPREIPPTCDFVLTGNARAAFSATEYLIEKGHRDIAVVTGSNTHFSANERLRGYQNALTQAGIPHHRRHHGAERGKHFHSRRPFGPELRRDRADPGDQAPADRRPPADLPHCRLRCGAPDRPDGRPAERGHRPSDLHHPDRAGIRPLPQLNFLLRRSFANRPAERFFRAKSFPAPLTSGRVHAKIKKGSSSLLLSIFAKD